MTGETLLRRAAKLVANGILPAFVEEAWKNYEAAVESLNDLLPYSEEPAIPKAVLTDLPVQKVRDYLEDCLSFERFELYEKNEHNLRDLLIEGPFFARSVTINYRRILFDVVAVNPPRRRHERHGRR